MKWLKPISITAVTLILCWFLDGRRTSSLPLAAGRFLDPIGGFWANAESDFPDWGGEMLVEGVQAPVTVHYDERRVPHIFAENEHDLYFAQGYVTARDRLWQMEFQTHSAAGRLSEIIADERVLRLDRLQRRRGMVWAAQNSQQMAEKDPATKLAVDAYTAGINAYISELSYADYPFEYKLLDYAPEPWTNLKTFLLLKLMAWDLTGRSDDLDQTRLAAELGLSKYAELFPAQPASTHPIVPVGTPFPMDTLRVDTPLASTYLPAVRMPKLEFPQPDPHNGSNNWVVAGSKTASGSPILCNDPHLRLRLPSLWYEIQLHSPEQNVYGVSLPGSPGVIIGFNEKIAWGVTNASRDVQDWYQIQLSEDKKTYAGSKGPTPVTVQKEEIKVRGKSSFIDEVMYTEYGPITYDPSFIDSVNNGPIHLAMRWKGHDPSNEFMTFYKLNRGKNYDDYRDALRHFECPGQNFIFASQQGDIAITQQGKFPVKWPFQGQFVLDGSNPQHAWQGFIPAEDNPHSRNPEQGFLFSTNQQPVAADYPYDVSGYYDFTRNRRVHKALMSMTGIRISDMQKLQNDNYNQLAADHLSMMLAFTDPALLSTDGKYAYDRLSAWNLMNEPEKTEPTLFQFWIETLVKEVWEDDLEGIGEEVKTPSSYLTAAWLTDTLAHDFVDDKRTTDKVESKTEILSRSLNKAMGEMAAWMKLEKLDHALWQEKNHVTVQHLARLEPFTYAPIQTGGNAGIVNANHGFHGASWRMVVEMGPRPVAYGVYPGGPSGNPGSPLFKVMVDPWAAGQYFPLNLYLNQEEAQSGAKISQTLKPAGK